MCVDILTGEKLLLILVANMELLYWSFRPSSRKEGGGWGYHYHYFCEIRFFREHENLV